MRLDTQIKRNVEEELRWDPNIDVNDIIGVAVKDGIVTLTGFVRRYNDIFEAEGGQARCERHRRVQRSRVAPARRRRKAGYG